MEPIVEVLARPQFLLSATAMLLQSPWQSWKRDCLQLRLSLVIVAVDCYCETLQLDVVAEG